VVEHAGGGDEGKLSQAQGFFRVAGLVFGPRQGTIEAGEMGSTQAVLGQAAEEVQACPAPRVEGMEAKGCNPGGTMPG
jgi:hypothetical protein